METQMFLRMASIILISVISTGSSYEVCPSPPVTYASIGDNVTLCWQIPAKTNMVNLKRFTVLALKRPVQLVMNKVASAGKDGKYFRTYEDNHDGLYEDRITVYADLQAGKLFLKMANYTNKMENVYCVLYEMSIINDVRTCHSNAVFLRTAGPDLPSNNYVNSTATKTNSTETPQLTKVYDVQRMKIGSDLPSDNYVNNTATEKNSAEIPQATKGPGKTDTRQGESYRTELIIVSTLLALFLVAVIIIVVWSKKTRSSKKIIYQ